MWRMVSHQLWTSWTEGVPSSRPGSRLISFMMLDRRTGSSWRRKTNDVRSQALIEPWGLWWRGKGNYLKSYRTWPKREERDIMSMSWIYWVFRALFTWISPSLLISKWIIGVIWIITAELFDGCILDSGGNRTSYLSGCWKDLFFHHFPNQAIASHNIIWLKFYLCL